MALLLIISPVGACRRRTKQGSRAMTVELDVYSGRPNPTWTLSAGEAEQIARLLQDLPRAQSPADEGLGYRGFVLVTSERDGSLPQSIRVNSGIVTVRQQGRVEHFVDARGLEKRLLEQARAHGFGSVLDGVRPR